MKDARSAVAAHWEDYAESFIQPIRANGLVSRFVTNPAVTGAYAEAWVRLMTHRMLGLKFRISTGAVVSPADKVRGLNNVPQCDLVIWDPSVLPGLFEAGEFALVPFASAKATIEIKRSMSTGLDEFREQLEKQSRRTPDRRSLGVVVSHSKRLFDIDCTPDWLAHAEGQPRMTRLLNEKNEPDTNGIMALIYFLSQVGGHDETIVV